MVFSSSAVDRYRYRPGICRETHLRRRVLPVYSLAPDRKPNRPEPRYGRAMEMLGEDRINQADLTDWRKLGQGLHARFRTRDFAAGVLFVNAIAEAGDAVGHHPRVTLGGGSTPPMQPGSRRCGRPC